MGLLDDAIREHLELKRRRGADPEEVAREQREALDAVAAGKVAGTAVDEPAPAPAPPADAAIDSAGAPPTPGHAAVDASAQPERSAGADETAELDMSSVLGPADDAEDQSAGPAGPDATEASSASTRPVPARPATDEDSLEWEVPGEAADPDTEEPEEDVLEETPDFLRDTPEQDRLWFEQQPPRDFDFDK